MSSTTSSLQGSHEPFHHGSASVDTGMESAFFNMLMQAPVAIVVFSGPSYVIDFVNDLYIAIAGKTHEELLNKPAFEAMPAAATQGFKELLDRIRSTGEPFTLTEHESIIERNGRQETTWLNIVYKPLKELDGSVNRIMILVTEVTEQVLKRLKKEEEEVILRQTKNQLELSISIGHIGAWHWDVPRNVLTWSKEQCAIYGINEADFGGRIQDFHQFVLPEDLHLLKNTANLERQAGGDYGYQFRIKRSDGEIRWVQGRSRSFYDSEGTVEYRTGVNIDITERKRVDEALQRSEEMFRSTFDNAAAGIAQVALDGSWLLVNDRLCAIVGYTKEELLASSFQQITHPEDLQKDLHFLQEALAGTRKSYTLEKRYIHKSGDIIWINLTVSLVRNGDGTPAYFISVVEDISARKKADEKMAESENRFRTLAEALPQMVWIRDANGTVEYQSQQWMRYSGVDVLNETWNAMLHPDDRGPSYKAWDESFSQGRPFRFELRLKDKNGEYRWHYSVADPLRDEAGKVIKWIGTLTDIHIQKTFAEELENTVALRTKQLQQKNLDLQNTESFLRQLIDSSVEFISVLDKDLNFITVNKRYEDEMKQTRSEVQGKQLFAITPKAEGTFQHQSILRALQGETVYLNKRPSVARPDLFTDTYFIPLLIQSQVEGVIIMSRDVSEIVESEKLLAQKNEQLERSNEDLQQFAHVASHDLKEPIRKVRTFGSRLEEEFGHLLPERGKLYLDKMQSSAERMFGLIDGVLNYSIINSLEDSAEVVDLNTVFENIKTDLEVLLEETKGKIYTDNLPTLRGSAVLLNQLFYNLLNNALKFLKPGVPPVIQITSGTVLGKDYEHATESDAVKTFAKISICDNGIGFRPEHAGKIFKTFTRLNSRDKFEGTGLGLALCKKIAERHGGYIYATGIEGEGACFYVLLPA